MVEYKFSLKSIIIIVILVIALLLVISGVNYLTLNGMIWYFLVISSCFISIHSMMTPTPAQEEEHLRKHYEVRGVYPWSDQNLSRSDLYELGTRYANRLQFAGLIGIFITFLIIIFVVLPFQSSFLDKSTKIVISSLL